jgi:hypothetical protein
LALTELLVKGTISSEMKSNLDEGGASIRWWIMSGRVEFEIKIEAIVVENLIRHITTARE